MNPEILTELQNLKIETQTDYELAADLLLDAVTSLKQLENQLQPLKSQLKAQREQLGPELSTLESAEALLKAAIVQARLDYERRVDEALRAGKPVPEPLAEPKGVSLVRRRKWRLEGQIHEVSEEFKKEVLDDAAIDAAIARGETPPGIELYDDLGVTFRPKDRS